MDTFIDSSINYTWLGIIVFLTIMVYYVLMRNVKTLELKFSVAFLLFSVFFYSGAGIAFEDVDNKYILQYVIYIIFLIAPFCFAKNTDRMDGYTNFDQYIFAHEKSIKKLAYLYILFLLLPCIFPIFKLNNVLNIFSAGNLVDFFDKQQSNSGLFVTICDNVSMILSPAFYIFIGILVTAKKQKFAICLIIIELLLDFCQLSYLGRYKLMIYASFIIFILLPPIIDGKINKRAFVVLGSFVVLMLPLLYIYVFFRLGNDVENVSFAVASEDLLLGEAYYPVFYDRILANNIEPSLLDMVFWIILLPIPSIILPIKPALDVSSFTYMITGLHKGDNGFAILLPSVIGESFTLGGPYLFWIHALIIGIVFMSFIKFASSHKTLFYLFLYYSIYSMVLGRGGAGSFLPSLINNNISLIIVYYLYRRRSSRIYN